MSTLTHNYFNHAGYADKPFSRLLEQIFHRGYNENSIIILYSDHGLRFGDITFTKAGIYEIRLPYFYIYVPDSLKLNGMNAVQLREIVRGNQRKLTSHFDIHATLLHALTGSVPENEPYGHSLFVDIPSDRTCETAGIPEQYCMCNSYVPARLNNEGRFSTNLVKQLNILLKPYSDLCAELTLNKTLRVHIRQNELDSPSAHYLVQFQTQPGEGKFEANVLLEQKNGANFDLTVLGSISRIDQYGHQSQCVAGKPSIEPYCYCKKKSTKKSLIAKTTPHS